jgi:hypothetical protein
MSQLPAPGLIHELEMRQDEALQSLAELELRIAEVLAQFGGATPDSEKTSKLQRKANAESLSASEPEHLELKLHQPAEEPHEEEDAAAA